MSRYALGSGNVVRNFDVSRDGRFLFARRPATRPTITVVTNWFEEVARKVDAGGR